MWVNQWVVNVDIIFIVFLASVYINSLKAYLFLSSTN